jgi:hypothetical protein
MTPPTQPAVPYTFARPSTWPVVIGIIAIVLGTLGILGGCWASIAYPVMEVILRAAPKEAAAGLEFAREWRTWTLTLGVGSGILAVLLLIAGIGLCRRRRWAISMTWWWAILKMLFVLMSMAMAVTMQQAQFTAIGGQGGGPAALPPGFNMLMGAVTAGFSLIWGWALPVFMIVWLSRGTIKREIAAWT